MPPLNLVVMRPSFALLSILALWPSVLRGAEYVEDGFLYYSYGQIVERRFADFPEKWLTIGGVKLGGSELISKLRTEFPEHLFVYINGAFQGTILCLRNSDVYMIFRTSEFGPDLIVAAIKPPRLACAEAKPIWNEGLELGLKLRIGQAKAEVAKYLGVDSIADVATIRYEDQIGDALVENSVHVEFQEDRLKLIALTESRE